MLLLGPASQSKAACSRRQFLQIGGAGLAGLGFANLAALQARAAAQGFSRETSVVLLFLAGGASHIETFDPKMAAPSEYRSLTGEVSTSLPGVTFGGTFPRLAKFADRMAIVRSFSHSVGDHEKAIQTVVSAGNPTQAGLGAVMARLRGTNHPANGMPTYCHLAEDEVDPQYNRERGRVIKADSPGGLGLAYAPFFPGGKGQANQNLELNIAPDRLDDRRFLLRSLDRFDRAVDSSGAMDGFDRFEQQAFQLILGNAKAAFDLGAEDPRTLAAYDTRDCKVGFKKKRPSTLGHQLLLARRLCEAGCGFVTIQSPGWDNHADGNNPGIEDGMAMLGTPLDHAVSTFLADLADRGLSDKILLVITGDFGRTPKINKRGGRDHWPSLCTLALAGGGLKMGQVIGQSTPRAEQPAATPVHLDNLLATIMHTLFDLPALRLQTNIPREILAMIEQADVIPGVG